MNFGNLIRGVIDRCVYTFDSRSKEILYKLPGEAQFYVRRDTSDKFSIWETWKFGAYLKEGFQIGSEDIVVDIGAHIGSFAIFAAKKAKYGRVFAFEPNIGSFGQLKKNVDLNKRTNVLVFNEAVSGDSKVATFYMDADNPAMSSLYEVYGKKVRRTIKSISLDKLFMDCKLRRVDLLKIDAEGAEEEIIAKVSKENLSRISRIVLEYHRFLRPNVVETITKILTKNGFQVRMAGNTIQRLVAGTGYIWAKR